MARQTTYTCDKCGLKMGVKTAVRVSVTIAEGSNAPLKRPYDFCPACFSDVKEMFSRYLHAKKGGEADGTATRFAEVPMVNGLCSSALPSCGSLCIDSPMHKLHLFPWENLQEDSASKPLFGDQEKPKDAETSEGISTVLDDAPFSEECKALCGSIDNEANPSEGEIKGQDAEHAQPAKPDAEGNFCEGEKGNLSEISCKESDGPESGESRRIARHGGECSLPKESSEESYEPTVFGPISPSEKERIFKLYLVDGLSEVEIAKRLGRLPRGVKWAINTAKATGELESLRRIFGENKPEYDERMSGKAYEAEGKASRWGFPWRRQPGQRLVHRGILRRQRRIKRRGISRRLHGVPADGGC